MAGIVVDSSIALLGLSERMRSDRFQEEVATIWLSADPHAIKENALRLSSGPNSLCATHALRRAWCYCTLALASRDCQRAFDGGAAPAHQLPPSVTQPCRIWERYQSSLMTRLRHEPWGGQILPALRRLLVVYGIRCRLLLSLHMRRALAACHARCRHARRRSRAGNNPARHAQSPTGGRSNSSAVMVTTASALEIRIALDAVSIATS